MTSARASLRRETAEDHERVDRLFSRADLSSPADYRRFLQAQAAAFIPVEEALEKAGAAALLEDWNDRRRSHLLRRDLRSLQASVPAPLDVSPFASNAQTWGGIYVLEGSRLGGTMLKRSLPSGFHAAFLGATAGSGAWRSLLMKLDERLRAPEELQVAAAAAKRVFGLFEQAGMQVFGEGVVSRGA